MALPVNIEELINGNTIEWERLEFKQGWNPEDVIHTMCAFANDINNWGGGYIIVGVAEINGQPILPPAGLQQNQLDSIQGEIVGLAHRINPNYFPITAPYLLQNRHILVLWCPAGDNRPYTAPSTLGNGTQRQHYVRVGSRSIVAQNENLRRLQELAARIPFDDRINNQAALADLDLGLIQAHLQEVKSSLFEESTSLTFQDLCRTMLIAKGPGEDIRPVNVGLLLFSKNPEKYFPRTRIELVVHKDQSGKQFYEKYFEGPIQKQLRDALSFIQTNIIKETVVKSVSKAESDRFFNYPFEAIEEALSNAVYHKSYELGSPIEVQVFLDHITILSHPGPVPPVNAIVLSTQKRIIAREYRNRRIGDFLKELKLTEGRGTGFPTIYSSLETNGSPEPKFETDEVSYFLVTIPAHPSNQVSIQVNNQADNGDNSFEFNNLEEIIAFCNGDSNQASVRASVGAGNHIKEIINSEVNDRVVEILKLLDKWIKRKEFFEELYLSNQSANRKKYLDPVIDLGWVSMEFPDKKTSPKQRYKLTEAGQKLLKLIGE